LISLYYRGHYSLVKRNYAVCMRPDILGLYMRSWSPTCNV